MVVKCFELLSMNWQFLHKNNLIGYWINLSELGQFFSMLNACLDCHIHRTGWDSCSLVMYDVYGLNEAKKRQGTTSS
jgi:hypothetical protein